MIHKKKIKVLLISPIRNHDIFCGDVIYTESLLNNPPDNVEYIDYISALNNGDIFERKRLRYLPKIFKKNILWFLEDIIPALCIFLINLFRKKNWLVAVPWKYFHIITPFDLIHIHVFNTNLSGHTAPIIISNACRADIYLKNILHYSDTRIKSIEHIEKHLCAIFNILDTSVRYQKAAHMIAFSETLKKSYLQDGCPENKISVIPIGIQNNNNTMASSNPPKDHVLIGFIAKDFIGKGGPFLLEAYKKIHAKYPDTKLIIIGSKPAISQKTCLQYNIEWINFIERTQLLEQYFCKLDIFAYPSLFDGFPLVVLEALSFGIPLLLSDFYALPEMIGNGSAGEISKAGNIQSIAEKLEIMLQKNYLQNKTKAALELFNTHYRIDIVRNKLETLYHKILTDKTTI